MIVGDDLSPVKILIVEDDAFTRKILKSMFDALGIDVLLAENGLMGLDIAREYKPELIISDYSMPEMNGLEMFKQIKKEAPHTKLVLMTIYTESNVLIKAINLGVDRFLEKPVIKDKLKKVLDLLMEDIRLAKEVSRYQNLLKTYRQGVDSSTIFSLLDTDGNFTYVNENLCTISEYSEDELIGDHYSKLRYNKQVNDVGLMSITDNTEDKILHGCVQNISKAGNKYVTELSLFPVLNENKISGYISIEQDMSFVVTHHKLQLQTFFDADSSIMYAYNDAFELVLSNNAFLNFFKYTSNTDAINKRFRLAKYSELEANRNKSESEYLIDEKNIIKSFLESSKSGKVIKLHLQLSEEDVEHVFTAHCFNLDQSYLGLDDLTVVRLNNITELENLRKEELTGAMLASIGKLSAGITHEINTPLTYVKGNIELLEGEVQESVPAGSFEEMQDYFNSINEGISRISVIIESMKEVTGEASFEKSSVNLFSTFVIAGRILYNRSKYIAPIFINGVPVDMNTNADSEIFMAEIAPKMLEQVWIILLNNSLDQLSHSDLTFEEKYIKIAIECMPDDRHKILIADNGGGISPKIMGRLFDLFASTKKHKGMGIGLNIAKSIIDKHNGSIRPYNDKHGAVFEIII